MQLSPVKIEVRKNLDIKAGDTIRVWQRIEEEIDKGKGEKEKKTRRQAFEGLIIARKHGSEPGGTFTIRKTSGGIGVELTLPLYSPKIEKIELVKRPRRVRRAKLYYLRDKAARAARKKMKQMKQIDRVLVEKEEEKKPEKEEGKEAGEDKPTGAKEAAKPEERETSAETKK